MGEKGGGKLAQTMLSSRLRTLLEWLHAHPELSFQEHETTLRVLRELEEAGVEVSRRGLETGLVASIRGAMPGPVIALRCDMDALPIQEESGLAYASEFPGRMHACGHDFHTAVMVGAAWLLQAMRPSLAGTVKIIFQPGEELAQGAPRVIHTGMLDDVQLYLGIHSYPGFASGTLGIKEGPVMAAVDRFAITLTGRGAHGAQPHKGIDPIVVQAALVQSLQTLVSRTLDPFTPAVLSVTHVEAGTTWNVIPQSAYLEGTVRTLSTQARKLLEDGLRRMASEVAAAYGAQASVDWFHGPPAVINDAPLCALARDTAQRMGFTVQHQEDTMGGEDFSCYLEKAPGIFIRVGTGGGYPGHHPKFTVDPAALEPAARYFATLAQACLDARGDQKQGGTLG